MKGMEASLVLIAAVLACAASQPLLNTTGQECNENSDCIPHNVCANHTCVDPCEGMCGVNAFCVVENHPTCACEPDFYGDPFVECEPTVDVECTENAQCPADEYCLHRRCLDPCQDPDVCGLNTECRVKNHRIICACLKMFTLIPNQGCKPMTIPECLTNSDCPKDHYCRQQKCVDPCQENVCGNNTICSVKNHFPVCASKLGYEGDALHNCVPLALPECQTNSNCSKDLACRQKKCVDPCTEDVCGNHTICSVKNHFPICTCELGYEGDALHNCVPSVVPECLTNSNCSTDQYCREQQCVDPCKEVVCGKNTICSVINHFPVCACKVGYEGDALRSCVPLVVPECLTNSNCSQDLACRQQKCVDPCQEDVCGNNTICSVKNHFPICTCKLGYEGDALHNCVPSGSEKETGKSNETSYFISDSKMSWFDAFDYCASNNMSIATVKDDKEWKSLLDAWRNKYINKYHLRPRFWIGGNDLGRYRKFVWASTGKRLTFTKWSQDEPMGEENHCLGVAPLSLHQFSSWLSFDCTELHHFACEIK